MKATSTDSTRERKSWFDAPVKDIMRQVYFDIEDIVRAIRAENVEI